MPKGPQLIKSRNRPPFCPPAKSPVPWPGLLPALSFRMDQRIRECSEVEGRTPGLGTISSLNVRLFSFRGSSFSPSNLWGSSVGPSLHCQGIEDRGPTNEPWLFSRPGRSHICPLPYSFLFLLPSFSDSEPLKFKQELENLSNLKEGPGMNLPLPPG